MADGLALVNTSASPWGSAPPSSVPSPLLSGYNGDEVSMLSSSVVDVFYFDASFFACTVTSCLGAITMPPAKFPLLNSPTACFFMRKDSRLERLCYVVKF